MEDKEAKGNEESKEFLPSLGSDPSRREVDSVNSDQWEKRDCG